MATPPFPAGPGDVGLDTGDSAPPRGAMIQGAVADVEVVPRMLIVAGTVLVVLVVASARLGGVHAVRRHPRRPRPEHEAVRCPADVGV